MASAKPSALVDTRVIYCGDNLEQLKKLPEARPPPETPGRLQPSRILIEIKEQRG